MKTRSARTRNAATDLIIVRLITVPVPARFTSSVLININADRGGRPCVRLARITEPLDTDRRLGGYDFFANCLSFSSSSFRRFVRPDRLVKPPRWRIHWPLNVSTLSVYRARSKTKSPSIIRVSSYAPSRRIDFRRRYYEHDFRSLQRE